MFWQIVAWLLIIGLAWGVLLEIRDVLGRFRRR